VNLGICLSVTDEGVKALAAPGRLRSLVLAHTKVTDAGLKELAACKQLREISLGGCDKVTGAGRAELLKALPMLAFLPE
jgi:hypothetical protein